MDLYEARLRKLEIDYEETLAAGERAEQRRRVEALVAEHRAQYQVLPDDADDTESCGIETPESYSPKHESVETVTETLERKIDPLTQDEVERIKSHMSTIKLNHRPSWADSITDERLVAMMRRIVHS